jgi:hypothetical protein
MIIAKKEQPKGNFYILKFDNMSFLQHGFYNTSFDNLEFYNLVFGIETYVASWNVYIFNYSRENWFWNVKEKIAELTRNVN